MQLPAARIAQPMVPCSTCTVAEEAVVDQTTTVKAEAGAPLNVWIANASISCSNATAYAGYTALLGMK